MLLLVTVRGGLSLVAAMLLPTIQPATAICPKPSESYCPDSSPATVKRLCQALELEQTMPFEMYSSKRRMEEENILAGVSPPKRFVEIFGMVNAQNAQTRA